MRNEILYPIGKIGAVQISEDIYEIRVVATHTKKNSLIFHINADNLQPFRYVL